MHHDSLVFFGDAVESLLDNVTSESIHAESQRVTANCLSNSDDLIRRSMLEAALDQEVTEAIDHERVGLSDNGLDNVILLIGRTYLELLLKEDRGLLIVVADDLVNYVLPVAAHIAIKQSTVVHGLDRRHVLRTTTLAGSL